MTEVTRAYYDDFSKGYNRGRDIGYHAMLDDLEFEAAKPYVKDKDVLEVGCGTGLIMDRLAEVSHGLTGVDLSLGMVRHAHHKGHKVACADVTALPFESNRFDSVCSFKVLPHVQNIGEAIGELVRVTRPGGYLVLEFYNPWSLRFWAKKLGGPRHISASRRESDVFTRWDSVWDIPKYVPAEAQVVDYQGVRIWTPMAAVHRVPWLGDRLGRLERISMKSPVKVFGGFLIAILRKKT